MLPEEIQICLMESFLKVLKIIMADALEPDPETIKRSSSRCVRLSAKAEQAERQKILDIVHAADMAQAAHHRKATSSSRPSRPTPLTMQLQQQRSPAPGRRSPQQAAEAEEGPSPGVQGFAVGQCVVVTGMPGHQLNGHTGVIRAWIAPRHAFCLHIGDGVTSLKQVLLVEPRNLRTAGAAAESAARREPAIEVPNMQSETAPSRAAPASAVVTVQNAAIEKGVASTSLSGGAIARPPRAQPPPRVALAAGSGGGQSQAGQRRRRETASGCGVQPGHVLGRRSNEDRDAGGEPHVRRSIIKEHEWVGRRLAISSDGDAASGRGGGGGEAQWATVSGYVPAVTRGDYEIEVALWHVAHDDRAEVWLDAEEVQAGLSLAACLEGGAGTRPPEDDDNPRGKALYDHEPGPLVGRRQRPTTQRLIDTLISGAGSGGGGFDCLEAREAPKFSFAGSDTASFWKSLERRLGGRAQVGVDWSGSASPLPVPSGSFGSCWLLPIEDATAIHIAQHAPALRAAGWRILSAEAALVAQLNNKVGFRALAEARGLLHLLPTHYASAASAEYPCVLKAAVGSHGHGTYIVHSAAEVRQLAPAGIGRDWVLQELVLGTRECATSMLVKEGVVLDCIVSTYEYEHAAYVWGRSDVRERREQRRHSRDVPAQHLDAFRALLAGFSGICNVNYKVDAAGRLRLFETNARVGADLACDVPPPLLRALFAKLDAEC